ncbi:MAG: helix-turn-helix transcriptional regulator [Desulfobacterales bacterium]|nr:helix-turn-helix transcriptional regulator [Desulfobacterales bacterium]
MTLEPGNFSNSVKLVRRQLGLSQEALAHELGVSFATINRWENGKTVPFNLARRQFEAFCEEMRKQGRLKPRPER